MEFDQRFKNAHRIAADRKGSRLVVTGAGESWLLVVDLDPTTGKLTLDETFRNSMANENHPAGKNNCPMLRESILLAQFGQMEYEERPSSTERSSVLSENNRPTHSVPIRNSQQET